MFGGLPGSTRAGEGGCQNDVVGRPGRLQPHGLGVMGKRLIEVSDLLHRVPKVDPGRNERLVEHRRLFEQLDGRL